MKNFAKLIMLAVIVVMTASSCKKEEITNIEQTINNTTIGSVESKYFLASDLNGLVVNVPNLDSNSTTIVSMVLAGLSPSTSAYIPDSAYINTKVWGALPSGYSDSTGIFWYKNYTIDYNLKTISFTSKTNAYPSNYFWPCVIKVDIIK